MPVYRVSSLQNLQGQRIMNVYHYDVNVSLGGADAIEIADVIRQEYIDSLLRGDMTADWAFVGIELRRVDVADQPAIEAAPAAGSLAGTSGTDELPTQIALLVSGTALTAFPRRVRTYLGGFSEGNTANALWGGPVQVRALDFIEGIDTIVGVAFSAERVAVRYTDSGSGPFVDAFNRIEAYQTSPVPATQRRRRIGVGV